MPSAESRQEFLKRLLVNDAMLENLTTTEDPSAATS
jgi:hypothetical protein